MSVASPHFRIDWSDDHTHFADQIGTHVCRRVRVRRESCAAGGIECAEVPPARVKQAVCGYGRAEKAQVQRMVKTILALPAAPTPDHAADALAVAICFALAPPLERLGS